MITHNDDHLTRLLDHCDYNYDYHPYLISVLIVFFLFSIHIEFNK